VLAGLWQLIGLENGAGAAHISDMTQDTHSKLLEVVVINRSHPKALMAGSGWR
jgi:hypothetical protein